MKKINIIYWISTGLFSAFMLFSAIPDILFVPEAKEIFKQLGYPMYLIPFIGIAKLLGAITILVPGFTRLKEWAYAGLVFDLIGATYSTICIDTPIQDWIFMIIPFSVVTVSYIFYHKKRKAVSIN